MASPVIPCDSCGSPIPDSDLETGSAVTLLGKRYCSGCKTEAIQNVSLEDLAPKPVAAKPAPPKTSVPTKAAARPAAPPPPPAEKPAARPAPKPAPRSEAPPRRAPGPKAASKPPVILIGAVIAVVAAVAIAGAVFFKGGPSAPVPKGGGSGVTAPPTVDKTAQAREAYAKVEDIAGRSGASWDHVLAAVDRAKAVCKGTEWEKKLEEIRTRAAREKEGDEAARDLNPLIDELKGAVATDQDFKRYGELQPKFQLALDMAAKTGSVKRDEIRALQRDYNGRYEKLAEPYYIEIHEAATQLAEERRYDDAIRKINTFPAPLRQSGAWMLLDKLRLDLEQRKKQSPSKK